jgi:hypothetical protein
MPMAVVPAHAGTHNHKWQLLKRSRQPFPFHNIGRGVWVPDRRSRCSLVRDDEVSIEPGEGTRREPSSGPEVYFAWGCFRDF